MIDLVRIPSTFSATQCLLQLLLVSTNDMGIWRCALFFLLVFGGVISAQSVHIRLLDGPLPTCTITVPPHLSDWFLSHGASITYKARSSFIDDQSGLLAARSPLLMNYRIG